MSKPILITGATGNIGQKLVRLLLARGECIKAATRYPTQYPATAGVEPVLFDFDQPETYTAALQNTERMVLMPRGLDLAPCTTAIPLLKEAKALGVEQIVLISGMGVEKIAKFPGHYQLEQAVEASGLAYTILRPTWFMSMFIQGLSHPRKRTQLCAPLGTAPLTFIDTADIAEVAAVTLTEGGHHNQVYTLTGAQALSLQECAAIISQAVGCSIIYDPVTDAEMSAIYQRGGMSAIAIDYMMWFFAAARAGLYATVTPTVAELLGRPPITLAHFAANHADAWQSV